MARKHDTETGTQCVQINLHEKIRLVREYSKQELFNQGKGLARRISLWKLLLVLSASGLQSK